MGRPHRRGIDVDPDSYESYSRAYDPAADLYDQNPPRGRSPGARRRNRSEPAATATAYDDYERGPVPREHRESRKYRKETEPDIYVPHSESTQDRKSHKTRYYDDGAPASRARSHGRSTDVYPRAANNYNDFNAYEPASRRGRERQHAYHPPRTSDTRRNKYSDFEPDPRQSDKRRPRYADHESADPRTAEPYRSRYQDYDDEPRGGDKRQPRYADYEGVPRRGSDTNRGRYANYDSDPRSHQRDHASQGRGRWGNGSPDRYVQPTGQRSARGRSMPRNGAMGGGASGGTRPRAKSAVGYAALGEAAQTAFRVGSQAALQMRNEPGPWIGEKGTRVATAALGAALVDTFVGHKATNMKGGMRHQALRQACEMGIRNFVMQPAVNTANRRSSSGGAGHSGSHATSHGSGGRRRH